MNIGDIFLKLVLDDKGVEAQAQRSGDKVGQTMGSRISRGLTTAFAAGGAIIGGATALLAPMATAADSALDSIRASTGAMGDELEGLQQDFRDVAGEVPDSLDTVSAVVGELASRTDLTGEALQSLAETVLDFSRATGTDAARNVELATRLFGDWSVATEDQTAALDMLLRASQVTGTSVDVLQESLVKFGAPLRQMGFSLEEAVAMLGKFEKEGVNADLVMGSLRIALGQMARAGESAPETFRRVVAEIERLGPSAEGTAMAMDLFGSRAGADMAAAIQEGRFELGALFDEIANGGDTVQSVTADTEDAADGFAGFLNTAVLALGEFAAPLAGFSEIAGPMLFALPLLTSAVGGLAGMLTGVAVPALLTVGRTIMGLIAATGPIGLIIAAVGLLFVAWQTNFLGIREIVATVAGAIGDAIGAVIGVIRSLVGVVADVAGAVGGFFDFITGGSQKSIAQIRSVKNAAATPTGQFVPQNMGGVRSYQSGAWDVPSTGLANLHAREMVIPPGPAQALRDWLGGSLGAGAAMGGGDTFVLAVDGQRRVVGTRDDVLDGWDQLGRFGDKG